MDRFDTLSTNIHMAKHSHHHHDIYNDNNNSIVSNDNSQMSNTQNCRVSMMDSTTITPATTTTTAINTDIQCMDLIPSSSSSIEMDNSVITFTNNNNNNERMPSVDQIDLSLWNDYSYDHRIENRINIIQQDREQIANEMDSIQTTEQNRTTD
ncbi:hypothetical protein HUG17_4561 [Dermatophagoides farinae]|nr:hypothetical protein HUG17_4561 [Dermatophagoides farinae]